jgi:hypothetical protein
MCGRVIVLPHRQIRFSRDALSQQIERREIPFALLRSADRSLRATVGECLLSGFGYILERAILEQLKTCPRFQVWEDKTFQVSTTAEHIVDTSLRT